MQRALWGSFMLGILTISIFPACGPATSSDTCDALYQQAGEQVIYKGEKTGDVVVHLTSEPPNLHPTNPSQANRNVIMGLVHLTLANVGDDGQLEPHLAAGPPEVSPDGLTYTYAIAPGASWEDGRPITARDVLFSYKLAVFEHTESSAARVYNDFIQDVKLDPEDEGVIHLVMAEKYILNPYLTSNNYILDQAFFDPDHLLDAYPFQEFNTPGGAPSQDEALIEWATTYRSAKYGNDPEFLKGGAGPYVVDDWQVGAQVTLRKKEAYWGEQQAAHVHDQFPETITFRFIPDDQSVALQIKQQALDVSAQLSTDAYYELLESPEAQCHYHLFKEPRQSVALILLNNQPDGIEQKPIFQDVRVRKALAYSIPLNDIIDQYFNQTAQRLNSPVSAHHADYNAQLADVAYDPEQALALLEAAGWTDTDQDGVRDRMIDGETVSLEFTLSYFSSQQALADMVERIRLELEAIGVRCKPEKLSPQAFSGNLQKHTYDAALLALSHSSAPYDFHQLWHSSGWPNGGNFTGFANDSVDVLSSMARVEFNPQKRKQLVDRIQAIIYEEQPAIFLFNPMVKVAIHKRFNGARVYNERPYVNVNSLRLLRAE